MRVFEKHKHWRFVKSVVRRLKQNGREVYLVGGCVRDGLLGKIPKDFDVASDAEPSLVRRIFARTVPVGEAFGVVLVVGKRGESLEVARFRSDANEGDGRRPEFVLPATARDDVARRDFTVNGLFYDIDSRRVLDYVGGRQDLRRRRIRTIGAPADRFREDELRRLRAFRFVSQLGFSIETSTLRALRQGDAVLSRVAHERIGQEMIKLMGGMRVESALRLMGRSPLWREVFPFAHQKLSRRHFAALRWIERTRSSHRWIWATCVVFLATSERQQMVEHLRHGWRLSQADIDRIVGCRDLIEGSAPTSDVPGWAPVEFARRLERHADLQLFLRRMVESPLLSASRRSGLRGNLAFFRRNAKKGVLPRPRITGADLVALGLDGPEVGRQLKALYVEQLQHPRRSKARLLAPLALVPQASADAPISVSRRQRSKEDGAARGP